MKAIKSLAVVFRLGVVAFVLLVTGNARAAVIESDICVYGGTSGGVAAAVQSARVGKNTVLAEPGRHLGGMTSGGLSAVDIGDPRTVGGIAREYFTRLVASYGQKLEWDKPFVSKGGGPATGGAYSIEPHVAEQVFSEMAKEAMVAVRFNARLASVKKSGAHITELVTEDGTIFRAKMFIDATYEGDLMAKAGVSYTLLREGNAKYGETYNGIHYTDKYLPRTKHLKPGPTGRVPGGQGVWDRDFPLDPYVIPGNANSGLLPLVQAGEPGRQGDSAPGVQAYCFRLCLTTNANRIPITAPANYDPKRYELVARFIAACLAIGDDMDLRWFSKYDALPNGKWDFNTATFGGNLPGASWAWPEASHAQRVAIAKEHEDYHRGLLYFLATDSRVPVKVRDEMKRFGLPQDEFTDNGGWPHQIYVREARRMVSDFVLTEHHTFGRETASNSVGLGSYGTDTHEIRRIVKNGVVAREGKTAGGRDGAGPYPIGYAAMVPKAAECDNLLVTFALSASHTAFSSIRMEPVLMVTSQSAATAAALAIDAGVPVQAVDYAMLRERLLADKQVIAWTAPEKKAVAPAKKKNNLKINPLHLLVALFGVCPPFAVAAGDFAGQRAQVLALGKLTNAPVMYPAEGVAAVGGSKPIFYEGLTWQGKPTRVFAWLGLPEKHGGKVPGVVLVHGGGGTAFKEWVKKWNDHGYAAISMAVEGQTDEAVPGTKPGTQWKRHAWSGPARDGIYADTEKPLAEQWMYHAVADTVLANSLLRSLPEVDAAKVGLSGISWGGVITSTVIGIDGRFAFGIPIYGCGHLFDADNQWGKALGGSASYREVWDPMVRMHLAKMPTLWLSWTGDTHFPLDCLSESYRAIAGPHMVSLIPNMHHGHSSGWNPPDGYAFAESVVKTDKPWLQQTQAGLVKGIARIEFTSTKPLQSATLTSTRDKGFTGARMWQESPATLETSGDRIIVTAPLPEGSTAWFINVRSGDLTGSSDYQQLNK